MLNIAIDLGSYSVKFLHYRQEKKSISIINTDEIILDIPQQDPENIDENFLWKIQLSTIKDYVNTINEEYQISMNLNSDIITTRFLNIPGKNKKRALMMLPFQIEEDLPFQLSEAHLSETIEIEGDHSNVMAAIVKKKHFDSFFEILVSTELNPKILSSDVSVISRYIQNNSSFFPDTFCILEMGHTSVRGYIFNDDKLISNHHSFIAGKAITEDIAKTYNISLEEANIYKHQNSFVLTENQMSSVTDKQKDFATMMNSTLQSLLSDIRRWDIGHRAKKRRNIKDYYICGGTSNIKNLEAYLSENLEANIHLFDPFKTVEKNEIELEKLNRSKLAIAATMAQTTKKRSQLINFLKGDYSLSSHLNIPLENIAFIGVRAFMLAVILSLGFITDRVFINKELKKTSIQVAKMLKNDKFSVSPRERRTVLKKTPEKILKKLQRQQRNLKQEVKLIQSAVKTNAIKSLTDVVNALAGFDVEILQFSSTDKKDFKLQLKTKDSITLDSLSTHLNSYVNQEFFVEVDKSALILNISGEERS